MFVIHKNVQKKKFKFLFLNTFKGVKKVAGGITNFWESTFEWGSIFQTNWIPSVFNWFCIYSSQVVILFFESTMLFKQQKAKKNFLLNNNNKNILIQQTYYPQNKW